MTSYLLRRLLYGAIVIIGVGVIVFFLLHASGDPTALLIPVGATEREAQAIREQLGLDRPLHEQFFKFVGNAVRGDLGMSLRYHQPAMRIVIERLPATFQLTCTALLFTVMVSLPMGIASAMRRNSVMDMVCTGLALVGQSMPTFWVGIVLVLVVALGTGLLPTSGFQSLKSLILPGITLGAYSAGVTTRMIRSCMLEVMSQDYVRTARAKGLSERIVVYKHAFRNAAIPVITVLGLQLGMLIGGAVVTESVFAFPGMGRLIVGAVASRDFPVIQSFVIIVAVMVVGINLAVDIVYSAIDPRVRNG